jgi:NTP pyrophosphatase (non-canonical NTP hydrolase)
VKTPTEKDYGDFIANSKWYRHAGDNDAHELGYLILGLAGEVGETVEVFKKLVRSIGFTDPNKFGDAIDPDDVVEGEVRSNESESESSVRGNLIYELGDVLYYLVSIVEFLEIDLETLMVTNTHKLWTRMSNTPHSHLRGEDWPFLNDRLSLESTEAYIKEHNL